MFILSKDGKNFVNCNNVASIYIQEIYCQYTNPDRWWEIRAMYPVVSEDVLYDTLDKYYDEKECQNAFDKLCSQIAESREHETIDIRYLQDY